jgi:hypothetical protein
MPALAPDLSPLELGFCVAVDVGGGTEVSEVELLDGLDELNVLLIGTADEGDSDTGTVLPLCCVTVPSYVMTNHCQLRNSQGCPGRPVGTNYRHCMESMERPCRCLPTGHHRSMTLSVPRKGESSAYSSRSQTT